MFFKDYPVITDTSRYAHAGARLALMENQLISQADLDQLRMATNMEELAKLMADTPYSGVIENISDIGQMVEPEIKEFRDEMYEILSEEDRPVLDVFFRKFDYNNLKMCLKKKLMGDEIRIEDLSSVGTISPEEMAQWFDGEEKNEEIPFPVSISAIEEEYEKEKEMRLIDAILDKACYRELVEVAENRKDDFLLDYVRQEIDLKNLLIFIRCKRAGIPLDWFILDGGYIDTDSFMSHAEDQGIDSAMASSDFQIYKSVYMNGLESLNRTGSYAELETAVRNHLISLLAEGRDTFFTIRPFIGYLLGKLHEIELIKKIYVHVQNGIDFGREKDLVYA